jgi:transcriptional regulator with XRE-family HTH domain
VATANTGPLIPRRRLGAAFRELREARGETLQQTAKALMFSPSKLSRIENGLAGEPHPRDVRDLLAHFQVNGAAAGEFEELAEDGRHPGWWQVPPYRIPPQLDELIAYESAASRINSYESTVAPGLLQTRAYAHATLSSVLPMLSASEIEHQVDIRMERQRRMQDRAHPPELCFVVPETILHRRIGSREVMYEQLTALLDVFNQDHIALHVIPFRAGIYPAAEMGSVAVYSFPDGIHDDVACIERYQHAEFLTRKSDADKHSRVLESLSEYYLDATQSRAFIKQIRGEKWHVEG